MRAKYIAENIEFRRGIGTKRGIGVGRSAQLKKWWLNTFAPGGPGLTVSYPLVIEKIKELVDEIELEVPINLNAGGTSGSWSNTKKHVQNASTTLHFGKSAGHYFRLEMDEDGDMFAETPSYLSDNPNRVRLGSWVEDPMEIIENLIDYVDHLEKEVVPFWRTMRGKDPVKEGMDFTRGIGTKEALGLGEISEIRRKLKKLKYTNEVDPIIEQIRDMFDDLLKQTKYSDDISFEGTYRAGSTDYAGVALITIKFNDVDYSLYLENSFPGNWQLYKPFTNPEPMGNIHSNSLRETLNSLIDYFKKEGLNEALDFKRGVGSKRALQVGSAAIRQQWWDEMREVGGTEAGHDIGQRLITLLKDINFDNLDLSGVGPTAAGIDTNKGEFEFDWDPAGDVCIKGHELGNLIENPEEIAIRFKEDIYDKLDFASDTYRLLNPKIRLDSRAKKEKPKPKSLMDRILGR